MSKSINILCITSYFKGVEFIKAGHARGHNMFLLTATKLRDEDWPRDAIKDSFFLDLQENGTWDMDHLIKGIAYQMRHIGFDRMVALDDFDVEHVAHLREYFRIPGMGSTTARYFRDKLAMRMKASETGIPVPAFTGLFKDADINAFADQIPAPWLIKPRSEASATGIQKINSKEELWSIVNDLGDKRSSYLIEQFAPGDVYHVDSLILEGRVLFSNASKYLDTPFEVAHGGGIFRSQTVETGSEDDQKLSSLNKDLMAAFGMQISASHSEFIKSRETGKFYFLETSARVGGANLAEMVEAATGVNLWREWAHAEIAVAQGEPFEPPLKQEGHAGIVVSLSRFENPDTSSFDDPEICWRLHKPWHIGFIVKTSTALRVRELLDGYTARIGQEFHASLSPPDASRV